MKTKTFVLAMFVASSAFAQSVIINSPGKKGTVAIKNATIVPVSSPTIPNGTIVFSNGLITAVGATVNIPANATVIDGTGLFVYPGLIDAGSHVGLEEISAVPGTVDTAELGDTNPNARAEVAVNPHSNVIPVTRVNGITSVVTEPEGGIISGSSAMINLAGWTPQEMTLKAPLAMHIHFPRLRTNGFDEQPQDEEATKEAAKNYTKQIDKLRDILKDAQAYSKASAAHIKRVDRDLILEALVPVVEGREPVVMHANLERDIRAALKFADEFKLKVILADAEDVARVIPELKSRNIPVILGPILSMPPREDDPYDLVFSNAKTLNDAGIPFAIQSQDAHNARNLPYNAAACAAFGLPKDVALRSVTLAPAQIFGVADKVGSLETGKLANIIVTDGDPLEIVTHVKHLYIGGEEITLDTNQTLLYEKFKARP
ncbi:MAG: amidohydrolase family protein [Acidobacteria bacterium]|nr:amidohydrolase family protein [Acidobacteriota bacterium]MBV9067228.1 amidohydrolase family protein [Acidobacteriota bacterium]MBV9186483.1 amidohydrolase family protein [Acidobacteriota bacterium]